MASVRRFSHEQELLRVDTAMKSPPRDHNGPPQHDPDNPVSQSQRMVPAATTVSFVLPSSSVNSQSTLGDTNSTPPTSSDGPASQSQGSMRSPGLRLSAPESKAQDIGNLPQSVPMQSDHVNGMDGTRADGTQKTSAPITPVSPVPSVGIVGQKRTASGALKPTIIRLQASPRQTSVTVHSNAATEGSGSPNISELSDRLRTRLSGAMAKVQRERERRSGEDAEKTASQQASPASLRGRMDRPASKSPRAILANLSRDTSTLTEEHNHGSSFTSMQGISSRLPSSSNLNGSIRSDGGVIRSNNTSSRPGGPSELSGGTRTYESFWRDHSVQSTSKLLEVQRAISHTTASGTSTNHPSMATTTALGPAMNMTSFSSNRRPRRSHHHHHHHHPTLPPTTKRTPSNLSTASSTTSITMPATTPPTRPPRRQEGSEATSRRPSVIRTPSQSAAMMEQDAVETLLYMSSPSHSQARPQSQAQGQQPQTPIRRTSAASSRLSTANNNPFLSPAEAVSAAMELDMIAISSEDEQEEDDDNDNNNEYNLDKTTSAVKHRRNKYNRLLNSRYPLTTLQVSDKEMDRMLDAISSDSSDAYL